MASQANEYDGGFRSWLRFWLRNSAKLTGWCLLGMCAGVVLKLAVDCVRYKALPLGGDWKVTGMAIEIGAIVLPLPVFVACGLFEMVARRATATASFLVGAFFGFLFWQLAFVAIFEF